MKYKLMPVVNGKTVTVTKEFRTRNSAIDYALSLYARNGFDVQIDEVIEKGNKHNLEYICTNVNRFQINRLAA